MLTTTALFSEYLAIGATSWLWLLPLIAQITNRNVDQLLVVTNGSGIVGAGLLIVATYIAGVLTESLSFGLEKVAVGPTSAPRKWVNKGLEDLSHDDWLHAQQYIWSSDGAFREFIYSRLRVTISRGVVMNGLIGLVVVLAVWSTSKAPVELLLMAPSAMSGLGIISWFLATREYRARVRVAGQLQARSQREASKSSPT